MNSMFGEENNSHLIMCHIKGAGGTVTELVLELADPEFFG